MILCEIHTQTARETRIHRCTQKYNSHTDTYTCNAVQGSFLYAKTQKHSICYKREMDSILNVYRGVGVAINIWSR